MGLFDSIASIYGLFYRYQVKNFTRMIAKFSHHIELTPQSKVLDVGCGTGALCATLAAIDCDVVGIDASSKMIDVAKRKTKKYPITYHIADATKHLPFKDKEFDIVFASFVLHGMKKEMRLEIYKELMRVARSYVVIHDYNSKRNLLTDIVETVERGDYFSFIQEADGEIASFFPHITTINVGKTSSWYICSCNSATTTTK